MQDSLILWSILLHVVWVAALYIVLALRKAAAVKAGGVDLRKTAIDNKAWPESVVRVSNNIDNNFESPILFYGVTIVSFLMGVTNTVAYICAFAYVLLRMVHSLVHIRSNYVPLRMRIFIVTLLLILAMIVNIGLSISG